MHLYHAALLLALVNGAPVSEVDWALRFAPIALDEKPAYITDLAFIPGTAELIVAFQPPGLARYRLDGDRAALIERVSLPDLGSVAYPSQCGVYVALDPGFADNRYLFVARCRDLERSVITRHTSLDPRGVEILTLGARALGEAVPYHNAGAIGFEPGGVLWAVFGDKDVPEMAQDPEAGLGAIVRIVPSRDPEAGGHTPAPGNHRGIVYAHGLRSPWRAARDRLGRFWIGDVGDTTAEELNLVSRAGQNFGWPMWEGRCKSDCGALTDPLVEVAHGKGVSLWVGVEYAGSRYEGKLAGRLIYGDFYGGWMNVIEADQSEVVSLDARVGLKTRISSWAGGPDDYLYVTTYGDPGSQLGGLWRVLIDTKISPRTTLPDGDGDGWPDVEDAFPTEPGQWADFDGDGYGDNSSGPKADECIESFGKSTAGVFGCPDEDGDGWSDEDELTDGTNPRDPKSHPPDDEGEDDGPEDEETRPKNTAQKGVDVKVLGIAAAGTVITLGAAWLILRSLRRGAAR